MFGPTLRIRRSFYVLFLHSPGTLCDAANHQLTPCGMILAGIRPGENVAMMGSVKIRMLICFGRLAASLLERERQFQLSVAP